MNNNSESRDLFQVIDSNDYQQFKQLLEAGADIQITREYGETLLHLAACKGHIELIKLLIEYGADIEARKTDLGKETPLARSVWFDNQEVAKILIKNGANTNCLVKYSDNLNYFNWAVEMGYLELVEMAITKGNNIPKSALHIAVTKGNLAMTELLLKNQMDVNQKNSQGDTPLFLAIENKHPEIAKFLIANGADIWAQNYEKYEKKDILRSACDHGFLWLVEDLVKQGANVNTTYENNWTPLTTAIFAGQSETAEFLLDCLSQISDQKINLNQKCGYGLGWTPLYLASRHCQAKLVKLLIEKGANLNILTTDRETPLFGAMDKGKREVIKVLLEHGADVNKGNKEGKTPLNKAVWRGDIEIVKMLLEAGADINTTIAWSGKSPLDYAIEANHKEITQLLLAKKGKLQAKDRLEQTHLHRAVLAKNVEMAQFLMDLIDLDASDQYGCTALHYACRLDLLAIVRSLLEKQPDLVLMPNKWGYTALHYAVIQGNREIVELLVHISSEINPQITQGNYQNWTPLDFAQQNKNQDIIDLLINHGAISVTPLTKHKYQSKYVTSKYCSECGEYRLYDTGMEVLHGNIFSPAADTDINVYYTCDNCGYEHTESGYLS